MAGVRQHLGECAWFWAWTLIGALATLGFISFGWLLLAPVCLVAVGVEAYAQPPRYTLLGLVSGIGVLLLVIAYINRDGPFDPHTWGSAGILFLVAGIVAFVIAGRSRHQTP